MWSLPSSSSLFSQYVGRSFLTPNESDYFIDLEERGREEVWFPKVEDTQLKTHRISLEIFIKQSFLWAEELTTWVRKESKKEGLETLWIHVHQLHYTMQKFSNRLKRSISLQNLEMVQMIVKQKLKEIGQVLIAIAGRIDEIKEKEETSVVYASFQGIFPLFLYHKEAMVQPLSFPLNKKGSTEFLVALRNIEEHFNSFSSISQKEIINTLDTLCITLGKEEKANKEFIEQIKQIQESLEEKKRFSNARVFDLSPKLVYTREKVENFVSLVLEKEETRSFLSETQRLEIVFAKKILLIGDQFFENPIGFRQQDWEVIEGDIKSRLLKLQNLPKLQREIIEGDEEKSDGFSSIERVVFSKEVYNQLEKCCQPYYLFTCACTIEEMIKSLDRILKEIEILKTIHTVVTTLCQQTPFPVLSHSGQLEIKSVSLLELMKNQTRFLIHIKNFLEKNQDLEIEKGNKIEESLKDFYKKLQEAYTKCSLLLKGWQEREKNNRRNWSFYPDEIVWTLEKVQGCQVLIGIEMGEETEIEEFECVQEKRLVDFFLDMKQRKEQKANVESNILEAMRDIDEES